MSHLHKLAANSTAASLGLLLACHPGTVQILNVELLCKDSESYFS